MPRNSLRLIPRSKLLVSVEHQLLTSVNRSNSLTVSITVAVLKTLTSSIIYRKCVSASCMTSDINTVALVLLASREYRYGNSQNVEAGAIWVMIRPTCWSA
jgi:hypothetical protein